ncbi:MULTISPECIES: hypothetical protein [unclassified Nocardioides]|uniref:hypothetical protein n=1 Tax=unclassified Nocardioides TaxID=2615069 RepID=UPI0006F3A7E0|nr:MULTISPECIES: hypothetical protein [unclassified Nocardioides]KRA37671.1 hypothetical protein ASD81_02925 [Nocardioides sp. Root614]KRA91631.1 hypothetical protein ASD84_03190 [Nocardioides sp. Root682]
MSGPAVTRIDHVNVASRDPEGTAAVLAEVLALPISAPQVGCPTFELIILGVGNMTLESTRQRGGPQPGEGITLAGIVFEPDTTAAAASAELQDRAIAHMAPLAFSGPHTRPETYTPYRHDADGPNWRVFPLDGVLNEATPIVSRPSARAMVAGTRGSLTVAAAAGRIASGRRLGRMAAGLLAPSAEYLAVCEWGHDVPARREADAERFAAAQAAGPGLTGVREVVVTASDVDAARERWQRLLDPATGTGDRWVLGEGPALVLEAGVRDGLARLVLGAASLEKTRSWLTNHALLGAGSTDTELRIEPTRVGGLDLRITG